MENKNNLKADSEKNYQDLGTPNFSGENFSQEAYAGKKMLSREDVSDDNQLGMKTEKTPSQKNSDGFFKKHKKFFKWTAIIGAVFLLLGSTVAAYLFWETNFQKVSIEKILPSDSNLVMQLTINPESEQFSFLEKNMEKFPGYDILKKRMDKVGEGKTLTQIFLDKLKEENLSYTQDIRPAIGEQAYVMIPDALNLRDNLKKDALLSQKKAGNFMAFLSKRVSSKEAGGDSRVAGEMNKKGFAIDSNEPLKPSDYIVAAQIKDIKKAREVLAKMKKDDSYEITQKKYAGYKYWEIKSRKEDSKDGEYFSGGRTFHAFLGGSWIFSSNEQYVKDAISRKKSYGAFSKLMRKAQQNSLESDKEYQKVAREIQAGREKKLAFFYLKMDSDKILRDSDCEKGSDCDPGKYFVFPPQIVLGAVWSSSEDGFQLETDFNKYSTGDLKNSSSEKSLATQFPLKENEHWLDMFFEHNNPREFYYNFKKNGLTEEGLKSLNDSLREIRAETGVDPEKDFIDLVSGSVALAIFDKKNEAPDSALSLEISDSAKMLESLKKIVEITKNIQLSLAAEKLERYQRLIDSSDTSYKDKQNFKTEMARISEDMKKITDTALEEKDLPEGKIYQFTPYWGEDYSSFGLGSLNFSLEDGRLILGNSPEATEAIMREMKGSKGMKLSQGEFFQKASQKFYPEKYASTYINTLGVWNIVQYYWGYYTNLMKEAYLLDDQEGFSEFDVGDEIAQKQEEFFFAAGAILRTIEVTGVSSSLGEDSARHLVFWNIKELPKEEKSRAEKTLNEMDSAGI